jgi:hypothetical protein
MNDFERGASSQPLTDYYRSDIPETGATFPGDGLFEANDGGRVVSGMHEEPDGRRYMLESFPYREDLVRLALENAHQRQVSAVLKNSPSADFYDLTPKS